MYFALQISKIRALLFLLRMGITTYKPTIMQIHDFNVVFSLQFTFLLTLARKISLHCISFAMI